MSLLALGRQVMLPGEGYRLNWFNLNPEMMNDKVCLDIRAANILFLGSVEASGTRAADMFK